MLQLAIMAKALEFLKGARGVAATQQHLNWPVCGQSDHQKSPNSSLSPLVLVTPAGYSTRMGKDLSMTGTGAAVSPAYHVGGPKLNHYSQTRVHTHTPMVHFIKANVHDSRYQQKLLFQVAFALLCTLPCTYNGRCDLRTLHFQI